MSSGRGKKKKSILKIRGMTISYRQFYNALFNSILRATMHPLLPLGAFSTTQDTTLQGVISDTYRDSFLSTLLLCCCAWWASDDKYSPTSIFNLFKYLQSITLFLFSCLTSGC